MIYYFPILFQQSIKQSHNISLLLGGVNMIVYASFATVSWFIIERAGRRKLFLWGTVGQGLSMVLTFACLIPGTPTAAKGAAVGLFTYIASFGATWLPLPWLYPAEINPIKTRAKANAVSTCSNWLYVNPPRNGVTRASLTIDFRFNFVVVMITPVMVANIGWGTYLFFAAVNACFIPFIYFFYPETSRRSLEEIDIIFAKGFVEVKSYVKAAQELPLLSEWEIEREAVRLGLIDEGEGRKGSLAATGARMGAGAGAAEKRGSSADEEAGRTVQEPVELGTKEA